MMTTKHRPAHDEPHEPAWLAALDAMLAAAGLVTVHSPNLIEFSSGAGLVTRVRLRGHGALGAEGTRLEAVAEVTTPLPDADVSPPSEVVELCNRMAVSSALVSGAAGGAARVCSRISFPAGDAALSRLYVELLRSTALHQAPWLDRCMAWLTGRESTLVATAKTPPRPTAAAITRELKQAEKRLDQLDVFCDSDGVALHAEFAWDEGVGRTPHGDRASRFTLDSKRGHALFGAGLAHELELPEELGSRAHAVACALNEMEMNAEETVPLLGAWCRTLDGRGIAHVGFVPHASYSEGLAASVSMWACQRSRWARARILALGGE